MVFPFKSATLCTLSPFSTIYNTPNVLTAKTLTSTPSLLYKTDARFAGTAAMSIFPCTIEYKSEHSECVAALAANEDAVAMLPQPFVTVAMTQNENIRVALDLTEEWEKASADGDTKATLITGVVIARNDFIEAHPDAVETFLQQYEASVNYVNDNVAEAAVLVGNYDIVAAQVAEKAIPECNITFIAGNDMKAKLSSYLGILFFFLVCVVVEIIIW